MDREDIIRMARQAGIKNDCDGIWCEADQLVAFSFLVAAAEREACAAFLESGVDLTGLAGDPMMQAFTGKLLMGCGTAIRALGTSKDLLQVGKTK